MQASVILAVLGTVVTVVLLVVALRASREQKPEPRQRERRDRLTAAAVRKNPGEALALVGDALAATHNPRALLPVILEVVTEATGARGGRVLEAGAEVGWTGEVGDAGDAVTFELGRDGGDTRLVLYPPPGGFAPDVQQLAEWLAAQAAVALENARLHHVVQRQAITDDLTGLVNRRRFVEALESEIVRARGFESLLSVVLADLDHFKLVNDRFGHHAGDEVLHRFADIVRAHLRDADVPGRLGGEEFAILVPETDAEGAGRVAERIRAAMAEIRLPTSGVVPVTASFGVAQLGRDESGEELLKRADRALYEAKSLGRNRVVVAGV
ncbi:MAG TPA: GGDEF domain-containing protein, partial [Gaiellaceae bacterium]|nr:GGDEF domain-containing protein [Gaiellaceae bacterium]